MNLSDNSKLQLAKSFTELAIQNNLFTQHADSSDTAKDITKFFNTIVILLIKVSLKISNLFPWQLSILPGILLFLVICFYPAWILFLLFLSESNRICYLSFHLLYPPISPPHLSGINNLMSYQEKRFLNYYTFLQRN